MNLRKDTRRTAFLTLFATYLLVKVVHTLVGFKYDLLAEGILNLKFVADLASWAVVYAAVYFLLRKLPLQKSEAVD